MPLRPRFALLTALLLTLATGCADAQPVDLSRTAIGMDIDISEVVLDLRVNDVPVFAPEGFGGNGQVITTLPMNPAFGPGANTIDLRVRPAEEGEVIMEPGLTVDVGVWDMASFPSPFDGRAMASHTTLTPDGAGTFSMATDAPGQPLMTAEPAQRIEGPSGPDGWSTWRIEVSVAVDALPPLAWRQGAQTLTPDDALEQEVRQQYAALHSAATAGSDAFRQFLAPMLARQAAAIGTDEETFFQTSVQPFFDPEAGWAVVDPDTVSSELTLFGDGRLASLVPIPSRFANQSGEVAAMFVYFWKDEQGRWLVIH